MIDQQIEQQDFREHYRVMYMFYDATHNVNGLTTPYRMNTNILWAVATYEVNTQYASIYHKIYHN